MLPRGIRNHNPGNIRVGDKWQGLAGPNDRLPEQEHERDFCVFKDPTWGIRAMARVLITYQDKYDLKTVRDIVDRWAPPVENNTDAYVSRVSEHMGVRESRVVNVHSFDTMYLLVEAIIHHENGMQPYTKAQITKGLVLAGVQPEEKSLGKSRTVLGGQVAMGATAGVATISELAAEVQGPLMQLEAYFPMAKWLLIGVIFVGIGTMLYARWDDKRKGLR